MRIQRRWSWLLTVGLSAMLTVGLGLWYAFAPVPRVPSVPPGPPPPSFPKGAFESVTITRLEEDRPPSLTRSSTNADKIEALSAVLRRGEPTPDHKCAEVGSITFRSKDGSETLVGIRPGHSPKHYEYEFRTDEGYDTFRVSRDAFLRAIADLGITGLRDLGR